MAIPIETTYNEYFKQGNINNKSSIKPFYINKTHPWLQYAAWKILSNIGISSRKVPNTYLEAFGSLGILSIRRYKNINPIFVFATDVFLELGFVNERIIEFRDTLVSSIAALKEISTISDLKEHLGWVDNKPKDTGPKLWEPTTSYKIGDEVIKDRKHMICIRSGRANVAIWDTIISGTDFINGNKPIATKLTETDHTLDILSYTSTIIPLGESRDKLHNSIGVKPTTNKESEMKKGIKPRKMKKGIKPRIGNRLVFTYTNGKTFTVRGLLYAEVAGMSIHYKTSTTDASGNITKQEVTRRITNDFSTVVIEHSRGSRSTLLDLRSERTKDTPKPPRTKKSREEWEALEAQKAAELEKQAKVEHLLSEAEKLLGK